jgi:hypothetical protein
MFTKGERKDFRSAGKKPRWYETRENPCFGQQMTTVFKRGSVTRFFAFGFFHESVSPKPLIMPIGPFQIFLKIRGDLCSSRFPTGVVDTGGKWQKSSSWRILIILFGHLWVVELIYI